MSVSARFVTHLIARSKFSGSSAAKLSSRMMTLGYCSNARAMILMTTFTRPSGSFVPATLVLPSATSGVPSSMRRAMPIEMPKPGWGLPRAMTGCAGSSLPIAAMPRPSRSSARPRRFSTTKAIRICCAAITVGLALRYRLPTTSTRTILTSATISICWIAASAASARLRQARLAMRRRCGLRTQGSLRVQTSPSGMAAATP
jgi:hypothetical protein